MILITMRICKISTGLTDHELSKKWTTDIFIYIYIYMLCYWLYIIAKIGNRSYKLPVGSQLLLNLSAGFKQVRIKLVVGQDGERLTRQ
jgi:energy-coupling factor transporter transmembrane protein EcfT